MYESLWLPVPTCSKHLSSKIYTTLQLVKKFPAVMQPESSLACMAVCLKLCSVTVQN